MPYLLPRGKKYYAVRHKFHVEEAMPLVATLPSDLARIRFYRPSIFRRQRIIPKHFVSPVMRDGPRIASSGQRSEKKGILRPFNPQSEPPRIGCQSQPSDLRFDRLQPSDDEVDSEYKRAFGRFIAREALLDEEIWTAAWLRAESHWERKAGSRHADIFKRRFAEKEFNAIKRRRSQQLADTSTCIVVVKKDEANVKRTILSSLVGTLDINIRHLLCGETLPGEHIMGPIFCSKDQPVYGYVANLSVAKYARRQGIASNMLLLAVEVARSYGANEVFVHVHKDNMAAQKLYEKMGFEMVKRAKPPSPEEQNFLLRLKIE